MLRPHADLLGVLQDQLELGVLLDDRDDRCGPIFWASIAISMNSASLKPLQMIGVSLSASATTASSSGLLPASRPKPYGRPKSSDFLDDLALLVDLDRVDAAVLPWYSCCVIALWKASWISPRRCFRMSVKRIRIGSAEAAQLQAIDQLLQVDRAARVLGRVDQHVALRRRSRSSPCPSGRRRTARWRR